MRPRGASGRAASTGRASPGRGRGAPGRSRVRADGNRPRDRHLTPLARMRPAAPRWSGGRGGGQRTCLAPPAAPRGWYRPAPLRARRGRGNSAAARPGHARLCVGSVPAAVRALTGAGRAAVVSPGVCSGCAALSVRGRPLILKEGSRTLLVWSTVRAEKRSMRCW